MREEPNKNVRWKIIFIILGITSSFLLIINFIPIFAEKSVLTTRFTGDFNGDRYSYVNKSNPDMNYFDSYNTIISNSCESIIHFDLELLPKETKELYLILRNYDFDSIDETTVEDVEINIILVDSNWSESEITWNNKPAHEELIDTVNASKITQSPFIERYNLKRTVNLTKFIKNSDLDEISICINITENNTNLNTSVYLGGPQLLWSYNKDLLSYTTLFTTIAIFSMIIGTLYYFRKEVYFCSNCNKKINLADRFCRSCGINFKKELMIKRSDYQIVLILLWTFIFSEGIFLIIMLLYNWLYFYSYLLIFLLIPWTILFYKLIKKKLRTIKELKEYRK